MKYLFISLLAVFVLACGPSDKELGRKLLAQGQKQKALHKYNSSKVLLDSMISRFPEQLELISLARVELKSIVILEQERNVFYLDSLLKIKQRELSPLLENFTLVSDNGEDTLLIHKRQRPENSYNRSYIRANLNTNGDFYLSSQYVGEANINHTNMKAICGDLVAQSAEFKEDGFVSRHFEDEDTKWEVIVFKNGSDNGISDLIASHAEDAIRVELRGGSGYTIYLEDFDKEAIKDGYEISFVLKEISGLSQNLANARKALFKAKLAK